MRLNILKPSDEEFDNFKFFWRDDWQGTDYAVVGASRRGCYGSCAGLDRGE